MTPSAGANCGEDRCLPRSNALLWAYQQHIQRNARAWQLGWGQAAPQWHIRVPNDFSTKEAEICLSRPEVKEEFGGRPDWDSQLLLPSWHRRQVVEPAYLRLLWSDLYPLTCLAWVALLGACAPASIALGVTGVRKPLRRDKAVVRRSRGVMLPKKMWNATKNIAIWKRFQNSF